MRGKDRVVEDLELEGGSTERGVLLKGPKV